MKEIITGADLRRMIISAAAAIEINKQALNDLNVFPVPDGDTGTNMAMTMTNAINETITIYDLKRLKPKHSLPVFSVTHRCRLSLSLSTQALISQSTHLPSIFLRFIKLSKKSSIRSMTVRFCFLSSAGTDSAECL